MNYNFLTFITFNSVDPTIIMSQFYGEVPILIANVSFGEVSGDRINVTGQPLCWFIILFMPNFPIRPPQFNFHRNNHKMLHFSNNIYVSIGTFSIMLNCINIDPLNNFCNEFRRGVFARVGTLLSVKSLIILTLRKVPI